MTEIPEHLRKRARRPSARPRPARPAAEPAAGAAPAADRPPRHQPRLRRRPPPPAPGGGRGGDRIPDYLLRPGPPAAQNVGLATDRPGGAVATAVADARPVASRARRAHPAPADRGEVRLHPGREGQPQDKVHTWPHLLVAEFVAALAITAFTLIFSIFVNAPLLALANPNQTPNPSKAPWYFLGLQELLTMFHPMVAGVTIPGMGLFVLILAPFIDQNPSNKPEDRKFAISLMTVHLMFWAVLVMIGSFFRGPGFNFVFPWSRGLSSSCDAPNGTTAPGESTNVRTVTIVVIVVVALVVLAAITLFAGVPPAGHGRSRRLPQPGDPPARPLAPRPPRSAPRSEPAPSLRGRDFERSVALARTGAAEIEPVRASAAGGLRAARPRDARRHPPAVPQPQHRRLHVDVDHRASAPPCVAFLWPSTTGGFGAKITVGKRRGHQGPASRTPTASSTCPRAACGSRSTRPTRCGKAGSVYPAASC